jgi:hypothetical protein
MSIGHLEIAKFLTMVGVFALSPLADAAIGSLSEHRASTTPRLKESVLFATPIEAARQGLADVHRLEPSSKKSAEENAKNDEYTKALGFASAQEASRATLGVPLQIQMSRLLSLKQFTEKSDPQSFIIDTGSMIYPLLVEGKVKSSLTVTKDRKTMSWRTTEWGSPKLIGLIERARGKSPQSSLVVLISPQNPLGLRFIGERAAGELLLTPIADIPKLKLTAGEQRPARSIFLSLVPVANKYTEAQLEGLKGQPPKP